MNKANETYWERYYSLRSINTEPVLYNVDDNNIGDLRVYCEGAEWHVKDAVTVMTAEDYDYSDYEI